LDWWGDLLTPNRTGNQTPHQRIYIIYIVLNSLQKELAERVQIIAFFLPKRLQNGKKFCIFAVHLKKLFTCSLAGNMALNGGPTLRASETPLICQPGTNVKPFLIYI
jgi:hypothetical protein